MKTRAACWFLGAGLIIGCSDVTAPAPGMFRAQLSGARVAAMSGPSNAGPIFSEQFPDPQFAIRMFAPQGDTIRVIAIHCPGQEPPARGRYAVNVSESDCLGSYSRVVSTLEGGATVLEQASASSGTVTISSSSEGQTVGTFNFTGILVLGSDSAGSMAASGAFSAGVVP